MRPGPLITRIAWPKIVRRMLTPSSPHFVAAHPFPSSASRRCMMSTTTPLERIGVGIDTARYGHRVWFLRPDHKPAAKPLTVLENRNGYQALQERLQQLRQQHPQAHFHI